MYLYNSKSGFEKAIYTVYRKVVSIKDVEGLISYLRERVLVEFKIALSNNENRLNWLFGVQIPSLEAFFKPETIEYISDTYFKHLLDSGDLDAFIKESKINKRHSQIKYKAEMFEKIDERVLDPILIFISEYYKDFFPYGNNGYVSYRSPVLEKARLAPDLSLEEKEIIKEEFLELIERNRQSIYVQETRRRNIGVPFLRNYLEKESRDYIGRIL